ncbi:M17 family peptidase N-terminal domain-containing protein, partial [Amycolatopsis solani]|uniref:M17 family peptidase N-terminal domain-containing protein n=1 Tax=Amycolatopsis solani TaxID=3028615 RepID=UPI0025B1D019
MTVPKLALSDNTGEALAKTRADVVVIGTLAGEDGPVLAAGAAAVDAAFDGRLADLLATLGASGKAEEVVKVPTLGKLPAAVVLAVGLGKPGDAVTPEQVRRAAGAAGRAAGRPAPPRR